jgi:hypothetical protein
MQGSSLIAGITPRGVSDVLAWAIQDRTAPLTPLLEDLAGVARGTLEFRPDHPGDAELAARHARLLGGGQCRTRAGHLYLGDLAAVWTCLTWQPARLPPGVAAALAGGGVPLGTLLPDMERADRRALAQSRPLRVDCSAVLLHRGEPFASATETITAAYLTAVSSAHSHGPAARRPRQPARTAGGPDR